MNLLDNLNICPGVTAGIGLGNLLGLLGEGTANPVTNGGDVLCVIGADPGAVPVRRSGRRAGRRAGQRGKPAASASRAATAEPRAPRRVPRAAWPNDQLAPGSPA